MAIEGRLGFTLLSVASLTIMVGCVLVLGLADIATRFGVGEYNSMEIQPEEK
jgi:hypothetical protein